jgi:hypothetical protein
MQALAPPPPPPLLLRVHALLGGAGAARIEGMGTAGSGMMSAATCLL